MSLYTPGPWEVHHRSVGAQWNDDEQSGLGWEFVEGKGPEEPMLRGLFSKAADAHLIAAAPDMLAVVESLDAFQRYFEERSEQPGYMPGNQFYSDKAMEIVHAARAAIAKARGEETL